MLPGGIVNSGSRTLAETRMVRCFNGHITVLANE